MMMDIRDIDILSLIPQRRPFVMVDRLTAFSETLSTGELTITGDNLFCRDNVLTETGIMENIAQTCAARIGYINMTNSESVKIGVIGAIKNLRIFGLPKVGDTITTTVKVVCEVLAITMVTAEVRCGDTLIASCEMKISLTDKEAKS